MGMCHLRHAWCPPEDIIMSKANSNSKGRFNKTGPATQQESQDVLLGQFARLRQQFSVQNTFMKRLAAQVEWLERQNQQLRMENVSLRQVPSVSSVSSGSWSSTSGSLSP